MAYNSSHTGAQIDSAVGAVIEKEATWDGKQAGIKAHKITLTAAKWSSSKQQTASVADVVADGTKQCIIAMPVDAGKNNAYVSAGIDVVAQGAGTLTFQADTVPSADIAVYVMIIPVSFS